MEVDTIFDPDPDLSWQADNLMNGKGNIPMFANEDVHMMVDESVESHRQEYFLTVEYDGATQVFDVRETFLGHFDMDCYSFQRKTNIFYLFATQKEWNLVKFLLCSSLSVTFRPGY